MLKFLPRDCFLDRAEIPVNPVAVGPAARVPVAYAVPQQRAAQGVGLRFGPAAQAARINDALPATGQDTMDQLVRALGLRARGTTVSPLSRGSSL